MSEHKARERREARMVDEKKEENNMIAFMACILASGAMAAEPGVLADESGAEFFVARARAILTAAHKESAPAGRADGSNG